MIDLYYNALTLTILLGILLFVGCVWRYFEEITQLFNNLVSSLEENALRIIAFIFLASLTISVLAGTGLI